MILQFKLVDLVPSSSPHYSLPAENMGELHANTYSKQGGYIGAGSEKEALRPHQPVACFIYLKANRSCDAYCVLPPPPLQVAMDGGTAVEEYSRKVQQAAVCRHHKQSAKVEMQCLLYASADR